MTTEDMLWDIEDRRTQVLHKTEAQMPQEARRLIELDVPALVAKVRALTALLALATAPACAPDPATTCTFTVSTEWTQQEDGVYTAEPCYVAAPDGSSYDFTLCCPEPYEVVGVESTSEVTCG